MKELRKKVLQECNISRTLRQKALGEEDYEKSKEIREKQQFHWEKFNFMKELSNALEREGK